MKSYFLTACIFFAATIAANCQNKIPIKKAFIFSAIKGTVSKPDSAVLPANTKFAKLTDGDTAAFQILSFKKNRLVLAFTPTVSFVGITKADLVIKNASGKFISKINLTGLSTNGLEGKNEPTLQTVADALGYKINVGWTTLANNSLPELQGDEIPYSLFQKAGKGNVEILPVARYSPDFELPFGYYIDSASSPQKKQVGILSKAGKFPEHQCLFPAVESGSGSFDPGKNIFGFYATGLTHTAFSEDVWNMLFFPENAVHATRIYPLKNDEGKLIPNSYLFCFEEAKNGDYNDYVFVVKNVKPVTKDFFTYLFNGKNLKGWHTYLKGIGANNDPDSDFKIENNVIHVLGKDLGYAMTDSAYSNYHFKVDFKWGERKWPPREDAKRDGGVCYNIPFNSPDSIWPSSIECQIQEGDVGDFWLLGFSTIKVKEVENKPANHTRMQKYADGEKPNGEWNTVEIISYNGKCIQVVNGVVVNVGDDASNKSGRILLQSEYSEIYYRNVKIRKL
ncbi:MAG TPA: DUF1080 domain-containing protein [Ginsengibacter sp.]